MPKTKEVKEHPILFTGEMIRAIQEKRKNKTRRLNGLHKINQDINSWALKNIRYADETGSSEPRLTVTFKHNDTGEDKIIKCPYKRGDHLWVRETWNRIWRFDEGEIFIYKADNNATPLRWKPSIFMPKEAARIWLEVVNVRVERVRDITEEDAIAEGVVAPFRVCSFEDRDSDEPFGYRYGFSTLWDSINAKRGYSWIVNPYVWPLEFKKIEVSR